MRDEGSGVGGRAGLIGSAVWMVKEGTEGGMEDDQ